MIRQISGLAEKPRLTMSTKETKKPSQLCFQLQWKDRCNRSVNSNTFTSTKRKLHSRHSIDLIEKSLHGNIAKLIPHLEQWLKTSANVNLQVLHCFAGRLSWKTGSFFHNVHKIHMWMGNCFAILRIFSLQQCNATIFQTCLPWRSVLAGCKEPKAKSQEDYKYVSCLRLLALLHTLGKQV